MLGAQTTYRDLIDSELIAERLPLLRTWRSVSPVARRCGTAAPSAAPPATRTRNPTSPRASSRSARSCDSHAPPGCERAAGEFFPGAFQADVPRRRAARGDRDPRGRRESGAATTSSSSRSRAGRSSRPPSSTMTDARVALGGVQAAPLLVELDEHRVRCDRGSGERRHHRAATTTRWRAATTKGRSPR